MHDMVRKKKLKVKKNRTKGMNTEMPNVSYLEITWIFFCLVKSRQIWYVVVITNTRAWRTLNSKTLLNQTLFLGHQHLHKGDNGRACSNQLQV